MDCDNDHSDDPAEWVTQNDIAELLDDVSFAIVPSRHDRERIEERLRKLGIDYGCLDKDESIRRWNRGGMPVALIHPASAGHGLNLQSGGSTIVWFSLTWSLELYQQTVARLWRQGQTSNTVVVMHLVTKGTIDERVLKALSAKDISQSALIEAVKADIGGEKDA